MRYRYGNPPVRHAAVAVALAAAIAGMACRSVPPRSLAHDGDLTATTQEHGTATAQEHEAHPTHAGFHRHHVALFLGGVDAVHETEDAHHEGEPERTTAFAVGLDYEYRVSRLIGVGLFGEYAGPRLETTVVALPLNLHLTRGLVLGVAPGAEFHDGHSRFLVRLQALYDIELGRGFSLAPVLAVDFTGGEEALVFGARTGRGF